MSATHEIKADQFLSLEELDQIIHSGTKISLSEAVIQKVQDCRSYLDRLMQESERAYYGINTGFGSLCNVKIGKEQLADLQLNLILSHACGQGDEVPQSIVKKMLLLKIQSLAYGHSGVSLRSLNKLLDLYNGGYYPLVYEKGSLGASGDLAPLAHLCLPLVGRGQVRKEGKLMSGAEVAAELGWTELKLESKEGLALLNGTQFMSAYGCELLLLAKEMLRQSVKVASISLDAFDATLEPFEAAIHEIRPHEGQLKVAASLRSLLAGSEIAKGVKTQVQDPYSFRCIPQVLGASWGVMEHVRSVFEREINSVTDNPNVFPQEDRILSGGNFHGQPLALALDYLCMALAELGNISERRTYWLLSGQRGLPPYLAANAGINSGFMIPQYTAAGIVSDNKTLCHPASVDSVPSSNGQEDHVSMGANAAVKCYKVLMNVQHIIAIELFTAAQALEFRRPKKSSAAVEEMMSAYRKEVPFLKQDDYMRDWMEKSRSFLF